MFLGFAKIKNKAFSVGRDSFSLSQIGQTIWFRFGEFPSDHGFTGNKHNDSIGLIFMRARYYVPGIGRFVQADTVVPDPGNP